MDQSDFKAQIFYYFRQSYYTSMLNCCKDATKKFKGESIFQLLYALCLIINYRTEEGLRVLETISSENDIKLAVIIAIMYANKLLGETNKEFYIHLDGQMREIRKSANAIDFYWSGIVLYTLRKLEKALDYLEKAVTLKSNLFEANALKGWILLELKKSEDKSSESITDIFRHCLDNGERDINATLGLVESYLYQNKFKEALAVANRTVVRHPSFDLALVLKMKIQLAMQDWDQATETLNRILLINSDNLDALKTSLIIMLCKSEDYSEAIPCIRKYLSVLDKTEPKNPKIIVETAQLFSRICERNVDILTETHKMVEKIVHSAPENLEILSELGYQCLLQNKLKEASKWFKMTQKINDSHTNAVVGSILVEIKQNELSRDGQELLFHLSKISEAEEMPRALLAKAMIASGTEECIGYLNKLTEIHLSSCENYYYSDFYLRILNPDFLLNVVTEYLKHTPVPSDVSFSSKVKEPDSIILNVTKILNVIISACPGMYQPLLLLSKIQYNFTGEITQAVANLDQVLQKDNVSSDAHILMAQIQIYNKTFERAAQYLESALSRDFKVRDNSNFHFLSGMVQKNLGNLQDAIKSFTTALNLVNSENVKPKTVDSVVSSPSNLSEKAAVYIELIDTHNRIGQKDEAAKVLEEAAEELQKTPEESRIIILCADQAIQDNNIQGALDLLNKVASSDCYYSHASTKIANILLKYRKDKHAFLQVYLNMIENNPGIESYDLLGDAYIEILEPDKAIAAYSKALELNPKNPYINLKLGETLEFAHYYKRAVNFYKDAISQTDNMKLKMQLANLYLLMKEYPKAENLLITEIELENTNNVYDLTFLQDKTQLLLLLASIQENSGNVAGALSTLKDAKENQNRVRKRLALELTTVPKNEIRVFTEICSKLAEMSVTQKDNEKAIEFYKEALEVSQQDTVVLTALAKLYMQLNRLELCLKICTSILQIDQENEDASVIMADIAFRKIDFDMASFHFTQLIIKQPTNWNALVRLVEILRRTGNLDDASEYLDNAEKMCANPHKESGLLYCKALYQWYSGNLNGALRNFNLTRQDHEWGLKAIYNMIEICLNPEDEMFTDQIIDTNDAEYNDSRSLALKTADRLLNELKQKLDNKEAIILRFKLLTNFRLLATKEKQNVEIALEGFIAIASQPIYKDHIGTTLGIATAYTILKQSQRAKNQLKRVIKNVWTFEDAEYLEKCWLLLSDFYIQSGKYDVALDLLNKVIIHNKSCSKSYEHMGFIAEKEQRYKDAANNYQLAWKYSGQTNATIGYKLAHSLLKSKNYADAIDIGHQVLKINPDYPRLKKDILDKSMNNLRT